MRKRKFSRVGIGELDRRTREARYRRAREMLDDPDVWRQVGDLAEGLAAYWHTGNEVGTFTAICPGCEIEEILREAATVNRGAQGRPSPGQAENPRPHD
jgi:hypothetical protein